MACEAGRAGRSGDSGGLPELCELLLDTPGSFGVVAPRTTINHQRYAGSYVGMYLHMNEVGGASDFRARKAALLFSLGATVGA